MDKMDELRAIGTIIEYQKQRKNYAFNQAKESFSNHSANASLNIDDISAIAGIKRELAWMEQASTEMTKIKGIEAEVGKIHHTISLGGMGTPTDEKLKELDQQWRRQLYDLKTQNADFRAMMLDEAYLQEQGLREYQNVSLSLDPEANAMTLGTLLQEGKIDKVTYMTHMLGADYLITDPDFIAQHSQEQTHTTGRTM